MDAYPDSERLLDLFNWASPGMVVTDEEGVVRLANKAAAELLGDAASPGGRLPETLGVQDYAALLAAERPVENLRVSFTDPDFPSGYGNVGFGEVAGRPYGFWALRPVTTHPTPAPRERGGPSTGQAWSDRVNGPDPSYTPVGAESVELIKGYYDRCPVAIHLIEEDGTVAHANWRDIALVGATAKPDGYVGHHIRRVYADQDVVEDFLGRWGEDAPIIDFRADFLNGGERVPVVIFSTVKLENDRVKNTRCFVFSDDDPARARDRVKGLDLDF